jgi:phenylpyruvate tautomerase
MPYLKIQTNLRVEEPARTQLMQRASRTAADTLGKSERYVMVALESDVPMCFAGSDSPLAFLELKSIGLPEARTGEFSRALCELVNAELGIDKERVYIEFEDAPRNMWGWNGGTF